MGSQTGQEDEGPAVLRGPWLAPAAALLFTCAYFHRAVFSGDVFMDWDALRVFSPARHYWATRVAAGEFPDWLPYDGLGQSFPGIVVTGAFHPTALLHLLLPVGPAVKLTVLSCFAVALLGTYGLLRAYAVPRAGALFAATTVTFSGYLVCITSNPTYLLAASAVPAALWGAVRFLRAPSVGRAAAGGALLALVLFGGDAQGFAVTCGLVVLVAAVDPEGGRGAVRAGRCAVLLLTGALLAAPQWVPAAGVALTAAPGARSLVEAEQRYALAPVRLWEMLIGPFLAERKVFARVPEPVVRALIPSGFNRPWVDSIFVGAPALVLALAGVASAARGWRTWVLAACWLLLLALCLGGALPVYGWVYQVVPPWRMFRYPEKLVPFVVLGLAVASGLGWRRCLGAGGSPRPVVLSGLGVALLAAGVTLAEVWGGLWTRGYARARWPDIPEPAAQGLSSQFVQMGWVAAALALGCAVVAGVGALRRARGPLLVGAQLGAAFLAQEPLYHVGDPALLETPPPYAEQVRRDAEPGVPPRVASAVRGFAPTRLPGYDSTTRDSLALLVSLAPDTAALWGVENSDGYLPGESVRVRRLKSDLPRWYGQWGPRVGVGWSVHSTTGAGARAPETGRSVAEDAVFGTALVAHAAMPRVYLARPRCVGTEDEALAALAALAPEARDVAVVECARPLPEGGDGAPGTARLERYAPEHVDVDVEAHGPAVLVVNDALQPGWTVTVDGTPAPVLAANVAVRAVEVPAGRHRVAWRYSTPGLRAGGALAALGLLGLAVVAVLEARRRGKSPREAGARTSLPEPS